MRRFEMMDDGSSKFWEIAVEGKSVTVRFGRIGSEGQTKTNDFASDAAAQTEATKLIRQKTGKGYAEVDGESKAAAAAQAEPARKTKKKEAPAKPKPGGEAPHASGGEAPHASDDDAPSATPRHGSLAWILPPGGGRDCFATDLAEPICVVGRWALSWLPSGAVVRVDLGTCETTVLGTCPPGEDGYRAIALDPSGQHWAVSNRDSCWLDGVLVGDALAALIFGRDGSLWGFRGQRVVRLGHDGAVLWEGAQRGDKLALAGDQPVVGSHAAAYLPDGAGGFRRVKVSHRETPRVLLCDDRHVVLAFWIEHKGKWCWRASVLAIADGSERTFSLIGFDGYGTIASGRLHWEAGELELESGAQRSFDVVPLGSEYAQSHYGGVTVSPDGRELWLVLLDAACVRRFAIDDRAENASDGFHAAQYPWALAVAHDGRVALGTDDGWEVRSASGALLHRSTAGQAVQLAFSPDGARLAIGNTTPAVEIVDASTFVTLVRAERSAGNGVAFMPDGERLLLVEDTAVLVGAHDLRDQAILKGKSPLCGGHPSGGRIVSIDQDRRAYVFDDPGLLPAGKKPPRLAPAVLVPNADVDSESGATLELSQGHLVVSTGTELRAIELAKGKVVAKALAPRTCGGDRIVALVAEGGATLHRLGETAPFARLAGRPERIAASPDGRRVVASVHRGLVLWTETGGRTPSTSHELVLPALGAPSTPTLAGFSGETQAFVVHARAVQVLAGVAEAFAREIGETFAGLVAVPEGDPYGADASVPLTLFVGAVVAVAAADAVQGQKGEKASLEVASFERAEALLRSHDVRLLAHLRAKATSVEDAHDVLVACGPLASAELSHGRTRVRLSWEDPEQSAAIKTRAAATLVAWND